MHILQCVSSLKKVNNNAGGGWGAGGAKQRAASWYFLLFQYRGVAEQLLQAHDWKLFREFMGPDVKAEDMAAYIRDLSRPGALSAGLYVRTQLDLPAGPLADILR